MCIDEKVRNCERESRGFYAQALMSEGYGVFKCALGVTCLFSDAS